MGSKPCSTYHRGSLHVPVAGERVIEAILVAAGEGRHVVQTVPDAHVAPAGHPRDPTVVHEDVRRLEAPVREHRRDQPIRQHLRCNGMAGLDDMDVNEGPLEAMWLWQFTRCPRERQERTGSES